jgi:predicted aspartyl protease
MAISSGRGCVWLAVVSLLAGGGASFAQVAHVFTSASLIPQPKVQVPEQLALSKDAVHRLTIPVMVDGQGPFPFVIDTGADRTVISKALATTLKLPSGPDVELHNSGGVDQVPTAAIASLGVGKRTVSDVNAPMLDPVDLDAQGMLGIDSLRDQHVVMDFRTGQMTSSPSRAEPYDPNTIVVHGKSRFGQLILVDAKVRGVRVYVILDSGAEVTVGNEVLRDLLTHGDVQHGQATQVISVTGRLTPGEFQDVDEAHIGGLTIRHMPLTFAELHTFARFGLTDKPAMLLGMDVLRMCRRVSVDFKRREASFTLDPGGPT